MQRNPLQLAAMAACGVMLGGMVLLQFVLTPDAAAPFPLFVAFSALWAFGFAMLWLSPTFGAAGTTAWGILSAWGAWSTHDGAATAENLFLVGGSLVAAALAGFYLAALRRGEASAA